MGFTGCGKTRPGGRPGIYPRHKANQISVGFSPCGMLYTGFTRRFEFFRNLFSRATKAIESMWASAPEGCLSPVSRDPPVFFRAAQAPPIVIPSMRSVGEATEPRNTRSLPMAVMFRSISPRFPAIVTSSTACVNSPFSIHNPNAPRE